MDEVKALIEAALFSAGRLLRVEDLARVCVSGNLGQIRRSADELVEEYATRGGGILIKRTDEGYVMGVRTELEDKVMHLVPDTEIPAPVLKTLALIAYEQPIKQSTVIKERGNKAYAYIKFLRQQGLIEARKEGRSRFLSVTPKFKEYFHIEDLKKFVEKKEDSTTVEEQKPPAGEESLKESENTSD
jgi:segregation and condensation protein B